MENPSRAKRDLSLDFLKGSAVLFMILTHVNAFFYNGTSSWMNFWTWWGASMAFVTFVFAYGVGYRKHIEKKSLDRPQILRRLGLLAIGYFLTAIWVDWIWFDKPAELADLFQVLTLQEIPAYTEFMLAFLLYGLLLVLFKKTFLSWIKKGWPLLLVGLLTYPLARHLYTLDWGVGLPTLVKGILVGHESLNRWGVLSYFVVFATGLIWGHHFLGKEKSKLSSLLVFGTLLAALLGLKIAGAYPERWPPSVLYLILGLAYSFGVFALWDLLRKIPKAILDFAVFIGKNALYFFVFHTLFVITISVIIGHQRFGELVTLGFFSWVILLNSLFAKAIQKPLSVI